MNGKLGARIVVAAMRTGQPQREGVILEVLTPGPNEHYRVRWADGHESTFFPTAGCATILAGPAQRAAGRRKP